MAGATDELSLVFQALADPTRRAILSRLRVRADDRRGLAEPFAMSRPAISQHLACSSGRGLIERTADAQWRRCTLRTEPLDEASAWVDRHRDEWNERFDLLDERLRALKGQTDA
jgi:DNA-binding transcriptional ArsR family regulator